MPTTLLTDIVARTSKAVAGRQFTLWDSSLRGFGLRVGAQSKTWTVMLGKDRRRLTLGRYPTMGVQVARGEARRLLLAAAVIRNERNLTPITFAEALGKFVELQLPQRRPSTAKDYERILRKHFEPMWRTRAMTDITRIDIHDALDGLGHTPAMANYAFSVIRLFCRWSLRRGYVLTSPCEGLQAPYKLTPRDRVLTREELKNVLAAAGPGTFGVIVSLLVLTAQRRSEIGNLRSEWINRDALIVTFPTTITKNRREHVLPITPYVLKQLPNAAGFLFPAVGNPEAGFNGWSKSMESFRRRSEVNHFSLHDLRRTGATMMAELGAPPHIVERILNHVTGSTAQSITHLGRIYNRYLYIDEMRTALARWEREVLTMMAS